MKRRILLLLSVVAVATSLTTFSPVSPASAAPDVCVGEGVATTGAPLTYPVIGPAALTTFGFGFTLGACVFKTGLTATGTVHGWCGLSTGAGVTGNGAIFAWVGVGGTLILGGDLVGVVNAAPNVVGGESCVSGADNFLVNGAVALNTISPQRACTSGSPCISVCDPTLSPVLTVTGIGGDTGTKTCGNTIVATCTIAATEKTCTATPSTLKNPRALMGCAASPGATAVCGDRPHV